MVWRAFDLSTRPKLPLALFTATSVFAHAEGASPALRLLGGKNDPLRQEQPHLRPRSCKVRPCAFALQSSVSSPYLQIARETGSSQAEIATTQHLR